MNNLPNKNHTLQPTVRTTNLNNAHPPAELARNNNIVSDSPILGTVASGTSGKRPASRAASSLGSLSGSENSSLQVDSSDLCAKVKSNLQALDHREIPDSPTPARRSKKKARTPRRQQISEGEHNSNSIPTAVTPPAPRRSQGVGTQSDIPSPSTFLAGFNSKLTQTISTTTNILCSICSVGDNKASKDFNSALQDFAESEAMSKPSPNARRRPVDVGLFSALLWALTALLLPARFLVTRGTVLVQAVFLLAQGNKADLFDPEIAKQSTLYLRKNKFKPWKFLKEMDLHQKINKEMMNRVRKGVEGTPHRGKGLFCHGSWVGQHEKMLEKHAVEAYGLVIECQDTDIGFLTVLWRFGAWRGWRQRCRDAAGTLAYVSKMRDAKRTPLSRLGCRLFEGLELPKEKNVCTWANLHLCRKL